MTSPTSLKPFDREAARNGAPIMYANGEEVAEWHVWKDGYITSRPVAAGGFLTHKSTGQYVFNEYGRDLVMAPPPMKEVTYWVVPRAGMQSGLVGALYSNELDAFIAAKNLFIDSNRIQPITLKVPV